MLIEFFKKLNNEYPPSDVFQHFLFYDAEIKIPVLGVWINEKYEYRKVNKDERFKVIGSLIKLFEVLNKKWPTPEDIYHIIIYDPEDEVLKLCLRIGAENVEVITVKESEFENTNRLVAEIEANLVWVEYKRRCERVD